LELFVSAEQAGGKVTVSINKANNKSIAIPATGGIDTWKTVALKDVRLTKGVNVIRIKADVGGFNFRKMEFTKSGL
jgi:hypothetical protein